VANQKVNFFVKLIHLYKVNQWSDFNRESWCRQKSETVIVCGVLIHSLLLMILMTMI